MRKQKKITEVQRIKARAKPWDEGGDHEGGGIWKMVYADFATAMMAFFLILWLSSTASQAQRDLLADYFNPVSVSRANSGADGALNGRSTDTIGSLTSPAGRQERSYPVASPPVVAKVGTERRAPYVSGAINGSGAAGENQGDTRADGEAFDRIEEAIKVALEKSARLRGLARNVIFERDVDGLHIQITDDRANSMFLSGKAELTEPARDLFRLVGSALVRAPHHVRVTGHTDGEPYRNPSYGNWELSADRANAARRAILDGGLAEARLFTVEGRADTQPLNPDDIYDIRNRRVEIVVLASVPDALGLYVEPPRTRDR